MLGYVGTAATLLYVAEAQLPAGLGNSPWCVSGVPGFQKTSSRSENRSTDRKSCLANRAAAMILRLLRIYFLWHCAQPNLLARRNCRKYDIPHVGIGIVYTDISFIKLVDSHQLSTVSTSDRWRMQFGTVCIISLIQNIILFSTHYNELRHVFSSLHQFFFDDFYA